MVITTTNGTRALLACRDAERVFLGAFVNFAATCRRLLMESKPIHLVCAGTDGRISYEDTLAAGAFAKHFKTWAMPWATTKPRSRPGCGRASKDSIWFRAGQNDPAAEMPIPWSGYLTRGQGGRRVVELGLGDDIAAAAWFNRPDHQIVAELQREPPRIVAEFGQSEGEAKAADAPAGCQRRETAAIDRQWLEQEPDEIGRERKAGLTMDVEMDKLVSLCKRRGFIFPSSEIYGGINGFWDYGPLGVELKRNIKEAWWRDNVQIARRHGRAGLLDHHEPAGLGGLGPRRRVSATRWSTAGPPRSGIGPTSSSYSPTSSPPSTTRESRPRPGWPGLGGTAEEAAELPEKRAAKLAKRFGQPAASAHGHPLHAARR